VAAADAGLLTERDLRGSGASRDALAARAPGAAAPGGGAPLARALDAVCAALAAGAPPAAARRALAAARSALVARLVPGPPRDWGAEGAALVEGFAKCFAAALQAPALPPSRERARPAPRRASSVDGSVRARGVGAGHRRVAYSPPPPALPY